MSGKYNQIISSEDPPALEKKRHIGCMAGILQLLDRHQIHFYGQKRISSARSSSGCERPKSTSCADNKDNLARSTQEPARFSADSRKIARRSLDFKDVVIDSLQRLDHPLKASIVACSAAVSEKPESIRFFSKPKDQSPRKSTDVKDAGKQNIPLSLSPHIAEKTIERAVSTESPEILSVSPWNLAVDNNSESTPRSSFESRQYAAPPRLSFVKDSPRFSCDGREISRSSTIERRDAAVLRCSSLKVRETSKLSPDTPSKRSPNVVARLMGLDEMPNSSSPVSASKVMEWKKLSNTSPRTGKASVEFGKSISEANIKDQERNRSEDNYDCFNGSSNILKISHSTVESPSAQSPSSQKLDEAQNAAFNVYEKRRKLVGELENCDRDLQALKKIVEALQLKEAVRSERTSENAETVTDHTPKIIMKPAKLAAKPALPSTSSIYVQSESALLSPKNSIRPNRTVFQNSGAEDPKPSNTFRNKNVSKRINFGNGDSPVEQKGKPPTGKLKMFGEGSNSAPAYPSGRSQSSMNSETLPSLKLKTSKSAAKEQRKNLVDMEIRVEKRRANGDEESPNGDTDAVSKFNLQNSQVKRSLDFGPEVKKTISNGINEVSRAELQASGKPREIEAGMDLSAENPSEVPEQPSPVSVLDSSFYKDDTSPIPVIKRATLNFREDEAKRLETLQRKDDWNSRSFIPRKSEQAENRNSAELMDLDRHSKTLRDQHNLVQIKPKLTESAGLILAQNHAESYDKYKRNGEKIPELDYVKQIFTASGLLQVQEDLSAGIYSSGSFPIDTEIFHDLEQKRKKSTPVAGGGDCSLLKQNRWLVFNTVNEILSGKFAVSPWIQFPHRIGSYNQLSGHGLLKQVFAEIERLRNVGCEDICDTLLNALQKDLARCRDEEGAEMGEVVMDVERMMFRDLIDETVSEMLFENCPVFISVPRRPPPAHYNRLHASNRKIVRLVG